MCQTSVKMLKELTKTVNNIAVDTAVLKEQGITNMREHKELKETLMSQDKRILNNTSYINKALGIVGVITVIGWVSVKSLFTS